MVHGEFEPTVAGRRRTRPTQLDAFRAPGHRGRGRRRRRHARHPARRRVRQPGPARADRPRAGARRPRRRARSTATTSRSTTRCAASCSRCRCPAPPTRACCGDADVSPTASPASSTSARSTSSAAATTACPCYNELRRAYGLPPRTSFTADHRRGDGPRSRPTRIDRQRPATILDVHSQLARRDGNAAPAGIAEAARRARSRASARTTLAARLKAIYGDVDKRRRLRRHGRRAARAAAPSSASCSSRSGRRQFTALRDGDRFFYQGDDALRLVERRYDIDDDHTLSQIVALDTGQQLPDNVFKADAE